MTDWTLLEQSGRYTEIAQLLIDDMNCDLEALAEDPYSVLADSRLVRVEVRDDMGDRCAGGGYYRTEPPTIYLHPTWGRRDNFTLLHELGHHLQQHHIEWGFHLLSLSSAARRLVEEQVSNQIASQILIPAHNDPLKVGMAHPAEVMAGLHTSTSASRSAVVQHVASTLPQNSKWILVVADSAGRVQHAITNYADNQPAKGSQQSGFAALAEEAQDGPLRRPFVEGLRYSNGSELHDMSAEAALDIDGKYVFIALTPQSRFGTGTVIFPEFECTNPSCGRSFTASEARRHCTKCGDPACPLCNRCSCDPLNTGQLCSKCFTRLTPGEVASGSHRC